MRAARIKGQVKSTLGRFVFTLRQRKSYARHGTIVLFHRVNDEYRNDTLTVSARDFDGYARLFKIYFDVVPVETLVAELRAGRSLEGKLALSFDDGYLDNYEVAAPILGRHNLPCTFFITTRFIASDERPWWDESLPAAPRWMSWEQVKELHAAGFTVGSHTLSHPDLGKIKGAEARREIFESKAEIESQIGAPVRLFSYPYGRADQMLPENRQLVREAGYEACFSAFGGLVPDGTDPFEIRRQPVSDYHVSPWMFLYELHRLQARPQMKATGGPSLYGTAGRKEKPA